MKTSLRDISDDLNRVLFNKGHAQKTENIGAVSLVIIHAATPKAKTTVMMATTEARAFTKTGINMKLPDNKFSGS